MKQAIILCSGGLDSVTTAHYIHSKKKYKKLTILFFNYNQRSLKAERKASKLTAKSLKAEFKEIKLPELKKLSTSTINIKKPHKKLSKSDLKNTKKESKNWYVPARNTIFISYALALADSQFISKKIKSDIFLGFKCEGSDSYPDTTPDYLRKFNSLSKKSLSFPIQIKSPLINKDKEAIVQLASKLKIPINKTHSCYTSNKHCGTCLACQLRKSAFYWANQKDLTLYKS